MATVALVVGNPLAAASLAVLAATFHALTGWPRSSVAFAATVLGALTAATLLVPGASPGSGAEVAAAWAAIPLTMAVMHRVADAGARVEGAVARERLIAESGLGIARAVDEDSVRAVSRATVATLLADVPGASARLLPAGAPPAARGAVRQDFPVPITPDDQRVLQVLSAEPVRDEVARALAIVATQLALALGRSVLTDDLVRRAGEDPLTGLLNRRRLDEVMTAALDGTARGPAAVITVDLDRFKQVNDTHGHAVGDALLTSVAARLRSHVREDDAVARLGGDEFLVLLTGERAADRAPDLAQRLLDAVSAPFEVAGLTVRVGASVGVALAAAGQGPDEVMRASDGAMYRAKQGGRGRVVLHDGAQAERPAAGARSVAGR